MKNMAKACLCRLYYGYLRLLEMTVRLEVEMPDIWTKICLTGRCHWFLA